MKRVFFLLISISVLLFSDTIGFKELTALVAADINKNIYLDQDIKDYTVDINLADHQQTGQLYEFYKIVLFSHDLQLQFNKAGNFFYIKPKLKSIERTVLPPVAVPAPVDRLHYYTYHIKHITNQDVIDCMSIFSDVKFHYLKQSDIIAYSATAADHSQIQKILNRADNKVVSKSVKITIFSVDKTKLKEIGSSINKLGISFKGSLYKNLLDSVSNVSTFNSGFDADIYLSYLVRLGVTTINHSPTVLLSNGVEAQINSVANVRYLTGTASVDNQNNNTVRENYEFKDVGLKIRMLPKIKNNWVYITLSLISEELISYEKDNPTTGKISYKNSFKIEKGKPLLLTGINKTITKTQNSNIPLLSDIPLLGQLFKGKNTSVESSNINILIEVL